MHRLWPVFFGAMVVGLIAVQNRQDRLVCRMSHRAMTPPLLPQLTSRWRYMSNHRMAATPLLLMSSVKEWDEVPRRACRGQ